MNLLLLQKLMARQLPRHVSLVHVYLFTPRDSSFCCSFQLLILLLLRVNGSTNVSIIDMTLEFMSFQFSKAIFLIYKRVSLIQKEEELEELL